MTDSTDPRDMTTAPVPAADVLNAHRDSIDRLDAVLVYTLAERFKHTRAVGALKARHGLAPYDPVREDEQAARLAKLARQAGLAPDFAMAILKFITTEVVRQHGEYQILK